MRSDIHNASAAVLTTQRIKTMNATSYQRYHSTALLSQIAFGDSLYDSLADSDAQIERDARRNRWLRRKAVK